MNKQNSTTAQYPIKLIKYITSAGVASRRKSFDIILKGQIKVNGEVIKEPSHLINENDKVEFQGKSVEIQKPVYVMLNKPVGYTCTNADPYAEKKAVDLIEIPNIRLFSVGRLDKDSKGLLLFTNDGKYADTLMHPRNEITKTYIVTVSQEISFRSIIEMTTKGIIDSGETLKALKIEKISKLKYKFVLNEGKKREIRRLVKCVESRVVSLKRIAIGTLKLGNLSEGKWKYLTNEDIQKTLTG